MLKIPKCSSKDRAWFKMVISGVFVDCEKDNPAYLSEDKIVIYDNDIYHLREVRDVLMGYGSFKDMQGDTVRIYQTEILVNS